MTDNGGKSNENSNKNDNETNSNEPVDWSKATKEECVDFVVKILDVDIQSA